MTDIRFTIILVLLMTVMMGLILSGIFTYMETGFAPGFTAKWVSSFLSTYAIVLPTVLVVSPVVQFVTRRIIAWLDRAKVGATPEAVALEAWRRNGAGHGGGSFEPLYEILSPEVSITMPLGPFRGENRGIAAARRIYGAIAGAQPRLVYETPHRVTAKGNTVVIEFKDHGTIAGYPYRNRIAASFDIKDRRVVAYREYFGDVDPAIVAMMNDTKA
jgi:ketosteroid isomerase-like protein